MLPTRLRLAAASCLCLLAWVLLPAAALPAGDTAVASAPGSAVVEGTLTLGGATVRYRAEGGQLTLTVTADKLDVRYADGTGMVTLQAGDTVLIAGELFTKGIGGVFNAQGFTLAPGLRFTIKNQSTKALSFFDNRLNKTVTVPAGAVVNLEVKVELLRSSDDLAKQLKIGQLVTIGAKKENPTAAVARVAGGLLLWANENLILQTGSLQLSLVPDSALLLTAGRLQLTDGRLTLAGDEVTVLTLTGVVLVISPAGKFDLAPGQSSTGRARSFSAPRAGTPPPGILIVKLRLTNSAAQVPIGPQKPASPEKVLIVLHIDNHDPLHTTGSFYQLTIVGVERDQYSPVP